MKSIHNMCPPISQSTIAEVIPATPLPVVIVLMIIMMLGSHQPGIPVHRFGNGLSFGESGHIGIPTMPAALAVHVSSNFGNVFNDTGFYPGLKLIIIILTVALISHLCSHIKLFRSLNQEF